jgi:hypothetical protein
MSHTSYCVYDTTSGVILRTGHCSEDHVEFQHVPDGCAIIEVGNEQPLFEMGWYIDITVGPPVPRAKPPFTGAQDKLLIAADDVERATLSGLAQPSTVYVIGPGRQETVVVTDGTYEFKSARAGRFTLYVDSFPAQRGQFGVTAT